MYILRSCYNNQIQPNSEDQDKMLQYVVEMGAASAYYTTVISPLEAAVSEPALLVQIQG